MTSLNRRFLAFDSRWLLILNHSALLLFAKYYLAVQRSWEQILFCFAVTFISESFSKWIRNKQFDWYSDLKTTAVISLGLLILVISREWWLYGALGAFATVAKNYLRDDGGRPVYNPTGFAIVSMLVFLPNYIFIRGDAYSGSPWILTQLTILGIFVVIRVSRWRMTLTYFLTVLGLSALLTIFFKHKFLHNFGPELGAEGLLFMFFMFTDPKTSPEKAEQQVLAGISIGALNILFRNFDIAYSQFIALFVVTSFLKLHFEWLLGAWIKFYSQIRKLLLAAKNLAAAPAYGIIVIGLMLSLHFSSVLFMILDFPLSDYRMFSTKRRLGAEGATETYIPFAKYSDGATVDLNVSGFYLGHAVMLKNFYNNREFVELNKFLKLTYRHLSRDGRVPLQAKVLGLKKISLGLNQSVPVTEQVYEFNF